MHIRKRIMAFLLSILMLASVCYIETPEVKTLSTKAMTQSFVSWYVKTFSSEGNIKEQEKHLKTLLDNDIMTALEEIISGAKQGVIDSAKATGIILDNVINNAKESIDNNGLVKSGFGTDAAWETVKKACSRSITCILNGGSIPGAFKTGALVTSADRLAESQEIADVMSKATSILDQYVFGGSLGNGEEGQLRLKAAAWLVCQEIRAMKNKGFSDLAIIGAMCNIYEESKFDPYMLQGGTTYAFYEFAQSSTLTLKLNGKDPWAENNQDLSLVKAGLIDGQRINYNVSLAPMSGIGLFQFTDCSTNKPRYSDYIKGYRRSYAINEFQQYTQDPMTCILGCEEYNYWVPPTNVDSSTVDTIVQEDGSTVTHEFDANLEEKLCSLASANKIAMASAEHQVGFFAEIDGPACWLINHNGKEYMNNNGYESLTSFSFDDYKNFNGIAGLSDYENARLATLLFLLGVERPATTSQGYAAITDTLNRRCNANLVSAISEIGGFNGYEGLNLDAIAYTADYNANALNYEDVLNGTGVYTHLRSLAQSGYYTASEISQACSGFEENVESILILADRSYMTKKELYNLVAWEEQVRTTSLENNLIMLGREITLWTGIMILVWTVLFYLAYWFDRVNTMFYLDFVGLLSFKRLQASDAPENSTYNLTKEELGNKRTRIVVHRDVMKICLIGTVVGTTFATGAVFDIMRGLIMWLYNFLS